MESTIDSIAFEPNNDPANPTVYATFWARAGALLLDFLIVSPVTILSIYNFILFKDSLLLILLAIIGLLYRPFFEYKYGATPGKMLTKLSIVNYDLQKITLKQALLRNIFHIISGVISFAVSITMAQSPEFANATTYTSYAVLAGTNQIQSWNSKITGVIFIIEIIFLLRDNRNRSLHDRIAETVVIKKLS